jgi:hypothetical protein
MFKGYDRWLDRDLPDFLPEPSDGEYEGKVHNEQVMFVIKEGAVDSFWIASDLNKIEVSGLLPDEVIDSLYDSAFYDCFNAAHEHD